MLILRAAENPESGIQTGGGLLDPVMLLGSSRAGDFDFDAPDHLDNFFFRAVSVNNQNDMQWRGCQERKMGLPPIRMGKLTCSIPKLRHASYIPHLFEMRFPNRAL